MPAYYVTLNPEVSGVTLVHGANAAIVFAATTTAAKERVAAQYPHDGAIWATATVTEVIADADFNGWTFRVNVHGGTGAGGDEAATVEFTGDATDNTVDEIAAQLVTLLNALTGIANAAYDAGTNILTVAGLADNIGDEKVTMEIVPPGGQEGVPSLVGTITDEGVEAAALTVQLPADAAVIPQLLASVLQV